MKSLSLMVAFLAGALCGPMVEVPCGLFYSARIVIPLCFVFLCVWSFQTARSAITIYVSWVCAFVWAVIHNPPIFMRGDQNLAVVVLSSGCGLVDDDLIVRVNDQIYQARGRASRGETVILHSHRDRITSVVPVAGEFQETPTSFCRLGLVIRAAIERRIEKFPKEVAPWMRGFILGDQDSIDGKAWESFRSLGLLHMLVLSGSHVSIIGVFIGFILRFPWWFYYVLGRLDILTWIKVTTVSNVGSAALLLVYCAAAGLTQSLQRAFFCFMVATIFPIFGIFRKKFSRVLLALCIQAFLCPMNFLSIGLIMSWTGVLVLISFTESSYLKPLWRLIIDAVLIQSVFFIISLIFFGRIGVLALPANLIFHAIFSVILPIDVIGLILPSSFIDHWIAMLNMGCLYCIEWLWEFQTNLSISEIVAPGLVTFAKPDGRLVIILIVVGLCIVSRFRELGTRDA